MHKTSILLSTLLVTALMATAASAQESTLSYTTAAATVRDDSIKPYAQSLILHGFDSTLGVAGFVQVVPYADFAEMLAGPTLTYEGMLTLGLMGGLENGSQDLPARGSAFGTLILPIVDLTVVTEYGVSGFWHQALFRAGPAPSDSGLGGHVGLISRRYFGEGIYADLETESLIAYVAGVVGFEDRADVDGDYGDFLRAELGLTLKTND